MSTALAGIPRTAVPNPVSLPLGSWPGPPLGIPVSMSNPNGMRGAAVTSACDCPQKSSCPNSWGRGAQMHHRSCLSVSMPSRLLLSGMWGPDIA